MDIGYVAYSYSGSNSPSTGRVALGKAILEKTLGTVKRFERGTDAERLKSLYRSAADGKVDILYLGPSEIDAKKSIEGLIDNSSSRIFWGF